MSPTQTAARQPSTVEQIANAIDTCQAKFGIAMVTLCNLHEVADGLSAAGRHQLIQAYQQRVRQSLRQNDSMIIVSDDHICLVFDDLLDNNHLRLAAIKIMRQLEPAVLIDSQALEPEAAVGLVYAGRRTSSTLDAESLYQLAKQTCARAIGHGHPYLVVNAADNRHEDRDWHLNQRVTSAMEHHHISMDYQPKILLSTGDLGGAEALVRWRDNGVIVPPNEYLAALNNDVLWQLTVYIYRRVLREMVDNQITTPISINIDPSNLAHPEFVEFMEREAKLWGVPAEQITLEITENRALFDIAQSTQLLETIRNRGFRISLDDFGAGHSNMRGIRELPLDEIKLDRSICADVTTNDDSLHISQTVLELAATLKIDTVAEGIEDAETLHTLHDLGATYGQGFYLSAPISLEEFLALQQTA